MSSQWGKIKANLVTDNVNTPLQEKLERMTTLVNFVAYLLFSDCQTISVVVKHSRSNPIFNFGLSFDEVDE